MGTKIANYFSMYYPIFTGETETSTIIKNLGHDKITLAPKFLEFYDFKSYGKVSTLQGYCHFDSIRESWEYLHNQNGVSKWFWPSQYNTDIIYHVEQNSSTSFYIVAIDKKGQEITRGSLITHNDVSRPIICGEDENYIFITCCPYDVNTYGAYTLGKIEKSGLTSMSLYTKPSAKVGSTYYITESVERIFTGMSLLSDQGGNFRIYSNVKSSTSTSVIANIYGDSVNYYKIQSSRAIPVDADNDNVYVAITDGSSTYKIYRVRIDKPGNSGSTALCTLDFGALTKSVEMPQFSWVGSNAYGQQTLRTFEFTDSNDKSYIGICFEGFKDYAANNTQASYAIYTFEIDAVDDTLLTYKGKFSVNGYTINLFPIDNDYSKAIVVTNGTVHSLITWNAATQEYVEASKIEGDIKSIGQDSTGRILTVNESQLQIELHTLTFPNIVEVYTDEDSYNYEGSQILTNLNVDAYNYLGQRIAVNVTLTIVGNGITFDDATISKTVTTSDSSTLAVPIAINAATLVRVTASIEV